MMTALIRNEIIKFKLHFDKHYLYILFHITSELYHCYNKIYPKGKQCIAPFNIMDSN